MASIDGVPVSPADLLARLGRPAVVTGVALANAVANGVIVVTGGAVRLTGSGLGCPTWPECIDGSLRPTPELAGHGVIEFTNRMLTFALVVVAVATVVAVFRSGRRDLRRLAVVSFLGIPAQALLGGVTVLTGLNPWYVAAHFLVSSVLVAVSTTLWLRSREPGVGRLVVRAPLTAITTGIEVPPAQSTPITALVRPAVLATDRSISPEMITSVMGVAIIRIGMTSSSRKPVVRTEANLGTKTMQ